MTDVADVNVGIIRFPGTNCDRDIEYAVNLVGANSHYIYWNETDLSQMDVVIIPGGFSYGDYLRAGSIAGITPIIDAIKDFAKKEAMVREAEGEKQSRILRAQGEAESIRQIAQAKAEGEATIIKNVFKAMKESDIDDNMLALKSMEALEKIAESDSTKLVLPSDTVNFLGSFKGIKEVLSNDNKKEEEETQ